VDFYEQFEHTIDGKGRLVLPASWRSGFAEGGFLAFLGRNGGLFPPTAWEQYRRRLETSGNFDRDAMAYVLSLVTPFQPDAQNRINVPGRLRQKLGLDRDVTLAGAGSYVALWDRRAWDDLERRVERPTDEGVSLADRFDSLGFL
jgi:MraZ protein